MKHRYRYNKRWFFLRKLNLDTSRRGNIFWPIKHGIDTISVASGIEVYKHKNGVALTFKGILVTWLLVSYLGDSAEVHLAKTPSSPLDKSWFKSLRVIWSPTEILSARLWRSIFCESVANLSFINLRAKRGGSLFEGGSYGTCSAWGLACVRQFLGLKGSEKWEYLDETRGEGSSGKAGKCGVVRFLITQPIWALNTFET